MQAADAVLLLHFAIAAFIVAGFFVIPLGAWRGWDFVRRRGLRLAHAGAIVFVAAEALAGIACPLTVLEDRLRGADTTQGFVERWVGALLYWAAPPWVFVSAYVALALLAIWLWRRIPPRPSSRA